ncbi:MAG: hypothetical protein BWK80_46225 [Desulfobacteraceae bacterium IS3]|nr:MAG: hypothetical protein BWK80_46225 [Desulfobacteraceae bacterium IS3]
MRNFAVKLFFNRKVTQSTAQSFAKGGVMIQKTLCYFAGNFAKLCGKIVFEPQSNAKYGAEFRKE